MRSVILLGLVLATMNAQPAAADGTIYGCANSRGRVRLITTSPPTCRARETPVSWNQQGPKGDKGDPGSPGPAGPGLVMRDANGALVGVVFETYVDTLSRIDPAFVNVVRSINGTAVKFQRVSTDTPADPRGLQPSFESSDCSGTPLMPKPPAIVPLPAIRPFFFGDRTIGFYQTGSIASHSVRSSLGYADDAAHCGAGNTFMSPYFCCIPEPAQVGDFAEAAAFDVATLGLVPPFHVEGP